MTVSFESLGLSETVLEGVRASGYKAPTEIQERTIPLALEGKDLIGLGETGSGKTAAFGLPILHRLHGEEAGLRALILVPTRELCVQVAEDLRRYGQGTGLHICTAFGGIDIGIQESAFKRGLDLLVACPGRLIDHLERRNLTLENVSTVVLDEADRMLDMGFLPQIRRIFVRCPLRRQNWLFSATMLPEVEELCGNFMPEAIRVQIGGLSQTPRTISHRFVAISNTDKERFTAVVLGQDASECGESLLRPVFMVAGDEDDVLALAGTAIAFVGQEWVLSGDRQGGDHERESGESLVEHGSDHWGEGCRETSRPSCSDFLFRRVGRILSRRPEDRSSYRSGSDRHRHP
jgi:superfamily II DNA/RNA helicase